MGWQKLIVGGTTFSASWEAAVTQVGENDCCCGDGGPVPPLLLSGVAAGSGPTGDCCGEGMVVRQRHHR
jgi:hypothetical protein